MDTGLSLILQRIKGSNVSILFSITIIYSSRFFTLDCNNLPKRLCTAMKELKKMVCENVVDIRKVDKGDVILVINYEERIKLEEVNILKIAKLCTKQESNWIENRKFVEEKMTFLYDVSFVKRHELIAVTGMLPGGVSGDLINMKDGSRKDAHAVDYNEFFAKQRTPHIYPLLKAHKLALADLIEVKPDEVCEKIPARLIVGMSICQLSRLQAWLESFLTPLSKLYGSFEYTKDSNDLLLDFMRLNDKVTVEVWDLDDTVLFGIDVQALYPSVQFKYLKRALLDCFTKCTDWSDSVIATTL